MTEKDLQTAKQSQDELDNGNIDNMMF